MKTKEVEINGVKIKVPISYKVKSRRKITTNIDKDLFDKIKEIKLTCNRDISEIFDCAFITIFNDKNIMKEFLNALVNY